MDIAKLRRMGLSDAEIIKLMGETERKGRIRNRVRMDVRRRSPLVVSAPTVVVVTLPAPQPLPPPPPPEPKIVFAEPDKVAIPIDWLPDMDCLMLADMRGLTKERIDLEVQRFRDYYTSTGTRRVNWNAAFKSWMNSPYFG